MLLSHRLRSMVTKPDGAAILREAGLLPVAPMCGNSYAQPLGEKNGGYRHPGCSGELISGKAVTGDPSILESLDPVSERAAEKRIGTEKLARMQEVVAGYSINPHWWERRAGSNTHSNDDDSVPQGRDRGSESEDRGRERQGRGSEQPLFCSFVLPDGTLLQSHPKIALTKKSFAPTAPAPNLQQAQQAMNQFLPTPAASPLLQQPPATPQGAAGMPAAAPGHATMTGIPQRPIGLDQPRDTRATAMPGVPGHAATNVIDQRGGLDPRGMTVDGNNAAGIKKLSRLIDGCVAQSTYNAPHGRRVDQSTQNDLQKAAVARSTALNHIKRAIGIAPQPLKRKKRPTTPWLGLGLGAGAAGAYGLSQGLASDAQADRVGQAVANYKPEAFHGKPPPGQTGLTHYQNTLSPAAQLTPFGVPIGKALVGVRSDPDIMQAMGTKDYTLKTPAEQQGVNGMVHYNTFANGPVPAYMHQLKAKLNATPVPAEMGVPAGTQYSDWMGRKLEDFVAGPNGANQRINPFEFTTNFMPHEGQAALMERFHNSLSPAEQAFRLKSEDPGPAYEKQVGNYLPKAKALVDTRNTLRDVGITGGGAAAGALGGHYLYNALMGDDEEESSTTGNTLASLAGAGLGGGAAYLAGTDHGRQLAGSAIQKLKQLILGVPKAANARVGGLRLNKEAEATPADTANDPAQSRVTIKEDSDTAARIKALQDKGHGLRRCLGCGSKQQCRCMRQHHDNLDIPEWTVPSCYECNGKTAGVAPFRPVNADPDFIAANQEWHDAEKANIVARRKRRLSDPAYLEAINSLSTLMNLQ